MSKLSIRPRNLDACKFIPIYKCEEIPDLHDYASINRSIPQLPTGMEKEEESEHHLQQAISAQQSKGTTGELVIPTPEVYDAPESFYNDLYPQSFKLPRQLIHVQPFAFENDIPDYDRDSEDEQWLESQRDIPNLTPFKFEELIDCFDKNSSQHVISLKEAKSLIKEDEDLIISVYDYWLNKRLRLQTPLIPLVKTERRDTSTTNNSNNPYIAFRRRTEKMQTRKNRKNDEISYEKMIKLRRDLSRALNLLQLVKKREETKKEHVKLTVDIFEKRYLLGDFNGNIINEISAQRQVRQASNYLPLNNVLKPNENKPPRNKDDGTQPRKKREYRKRHRPEVVQRTEQEISEYTFTSDDEELNDNLSHSVSDQDEDDSDGPYAFKRKKGCQYHAPLSDSFGNWPFYSAEERVPNNLVKKYCLTELRQDDRRIFAYTRRRIGRGGRLIFDRLKFDPKYSEDLTNDNQETDNDKFDYFKPKSPVFRDVDNFTDSLIEEDDSTNDLLFIEDGNLNSSVPINLNDYLHATIIPQPKSTQLDFKSVQFAVSAVLSTSTVNNSVQINNNNSSNGPAQLNNNLEYDKLSSYSSPTLSSNFQNQQHSPSTVQINSSLNTNSINSINSTTLNQQSSITSQQSTLNSNQLQNQLQFQNNQQQQTTAQQLLNQQSNGLTNSSNMFKIKFQNSNQNSINSEPKLTPTDVT